MTDDDQLPNEDYMTAAELMRAATEQDRLGNNLMLPNSARIRHKRNAQRLRSKAIVKATKQAR